MQYMPIANIDIGTRQRKARTEDSIKALAQDIAENGLHHAIQVYGNDHTANLATGAGRIDAIRYLHANGTPVLYAEEPVPPATVPVIFRKDRGELSRHLIEFGENEHRAPLSWQDRDAALLVIKKLREQEHGKTTNIELARQIIDEPTIPIKLNERTLAEEISDAEFLQAFSNDTDVQHASSKKEAMKTARRKSEEILLKQLGSLAKPTVHELYVGHYHDVLLADEHKGRYACVIADPPYNVGADSFGSQTRIPHTYDDSTYDLGTTVYMLVRSINRVSADLAHAYVFMDFRAFPFYQTVFQDYGWNVQPWPLIADKGNRGINSRDRVWYRRTYECILFASRGGKLLTTSNQSVKPCPQPEDKIHGAQKPVELYVSLIDNSTMPGDHVLDPCCGSGTIFEAATQVNRIAVGIEVDPEIAAIARSRMS